MGDEDEATVERLRRIDDVLQALDDVPAGDMPPMRLLFRLSELGVKDPSSLSVDVLRRRVQAIRRLYGGRGGAERRVAATSERSKRVH